MPGIITITLNPAIDKSTTIGSLAPEKKMQCTAPFFEPGGGGVNVARAIKKLGGEATAIYFAGGYTGKFFTQLLDKEGIDSLVIDISKHTRENLIVTDTTSNLQYRFGMPGPEIREEEWTSLLDMISKLDKVDFIVASGSVPKGVPEDIFLRIGEIAKKKKINYVVDTSGVPLAYATETKLFFLKPNLGELCALAGKTEFRDTEEIINAAASILKKKKCNAMVISMGSHGALLVNNELKRQIIPPAVKRKSTVGAGDSMVAGILFSLSHNNSLEEAVKYGVACGTAATMNPGTELCRKEDAEKIFNALTTQQLTL